MENDHQHPAVKRGFLTCYLLSEMQEDDQRYQAATSNLYQENRLIIGIAIQVIEERGGWITNSKRETKYPVSPQGLCFKLFFPKTLQAAWVILHLLVEIKCRQCRYNML